MKKITLFLMTKKGYEVLEALCKNCSELIDFVVIGRDKSVSNDYYFEIKQLCETYKIPFYDYREKFEVGSEYAIAVSWRWLLNLSGSRLIIFHDSILPRYRGFNPLVSYLINGEKKIGVTVLFANEEYDRGEIIAQSECDIKYPIKISEAIDLVSKQYAELAVNIAREIYNGKELYGKLQNEADASYSLWRDEEDYKINWKLSASEIKRFVDAVGFPYKGASTLVNGKLARVLEVEEINDVIIENRCPGKIIFMKDVYPVVVCGSGLLSIKALIEDKTGKFLLPLEKFRIKFK